MYCRMQARRPWAIARRPALATFHAVLDGHCFPSHRRACLARTERLPPADVRVEPLCSIPTPSSTARSGRPRRFAAILARTGGSPVGDRRGLRRRAHHDPVACPSTPRPRIGPPRSVDPALSFTEGRPSRDGGEPSPRSSARASVARAWGARPSSGASPACCSCGLRHWMARRADQGGADLTLGALQTIVPMSATRCLPAPRPSPKRRWTLDALVSSAVGFPLSAFLVALPRARGEPPIQ